MESMGAIAGRDPHRILVASLLLPIMLYSADQLAFEFDKVPQAIGAKSYLKTAYHDIHIVAPTIRYLLMPNRLAEPK